MLIKQNRGRHWLSRQRRAAVALKMMGLGACLWLLVGLVFGEMGLLRYLDMREHAGRLEGELASLQAEKAALEKEVLRLQRDPAKIEQVARERLGYVRKGETVYQLTPGADDGKGGEERP
ncbi:MAG: septum formation initiator family protein [Nitrospira sp.]|nr:septum formation initiator family protein [Nitrospira sp.]